MLFFQINLSFYLFHALLESEVHFSRHVGSKEGINDDFYKFYGVIGPPANLKYRFENLGQF